MISVLTYCENVFDGTHNTPEPCAEGHALLTSKNIVNGCLDKSDCYLISESDYHEINKRSQVHQWDILFSMIGTVGSVCLVTESDENIDFAIKNMGVFSCRNARKARWLYYYLQSPYVKKLIQNYLNGAVQKFLPLGWLRGLDVPKLTPEREAASNLLWNIDCLIENNRMVCFDLEAAAKLLYDYWFVQFDFPDENGKPYKSSGGKMVWSDKLRREIPEGFEPVELLDTCSIIDCLHSKKPEFHFESEQFYLLSLENLTKDGYVDCRNKYFISKEDYERWTNNVVTRENDFVITNAGRAGDVVKIPSDVTCAIGRNLTLIRPKAIDPYYLRQFFKSPYFRQQVTVGLDTGSFFNSFNVHAIKKLVVLKPSEQVCRNYCKIIKPMISLIEQLLRSNQELSSLRDFLLPLLMNGQVTIGNDGK